MVPEAHSVRFCQRPVDLSTRPNDEFGSKTSKAVELKPADD